MSKIKFASNDKIYSIINTTLLLLVIAVVLYPLILVVSSSFSDAYEVAAGNIWLFPVKFSLEGYKTVFTYRNIWTGYGNTVFYTVFGTIINVVITIMAAYPLSRKDLKGGSFIMMVFSFTMLFNGGLIPTYMLISKLGLINTRWVMLLPTAMSIWNVIITRTFYQTTIPDELLEAAKLDGCRDYMFILKIVIPLSGAITAVNVLFYAIGHWNAFFNAFIYLHDKKLQPLQIILREILIMSRIDPSSYKAEEAANKEYLAYLIKYSLIIVASIPMLVAYPFVQKYFIKGIMIGSIKG